MAKLARRYTYSVTQIWSDLRERGWSPADLARETGLSKPTINRFLSNERQTPRTIRAIAGVMKQPIGRYIRTRRYAKGARP